MWAQTCWCCYGETGFGELGESSEQEHEGCSACMEPNTYPKAHMGLSSCVCVCVCVSVCVHFKDCYGGSAQWSCDDNCINRVLHLWCLWKVTFFSTLKCVWNTIYHHTPARKSEIQAWLPHVMWMWSPRMLQHFLLSHQTYMGRTISGPGLEKPRWMLSELIHRLCKLSCCELLRRCREIRVKKLANKDKNNNNNSCPTDR